LTNTLTTYKEITSQQILEELATELIDKNARALVSKVKWFKIKGLTESNSEKYPIAIVGNGPPVLCLHGFDSCFLEFRRLYPLLLEKYTLIIPDLFGFGFSPRPKGVNYKLDSIIKHLNGVINQFFNNTPIDIIGASMGGAIAMEIAKTNPKKINRLFLLSPAGLIGKANKVPWPLNHLGVCFLRQNFVREQLCKQAFAYPQKSVGNAEKQIASIHLNVPGWSRSLADFALNGGVANCANPIPNQPFKILIGDKDRIIPKEEKKEIKQILKGNIQIIEDCGHLPHIDQPEKVAKYFNDFTRKNDY